MLSFAAEFPVGEAAGIQDFISVARNWIVNSPHLSFTDVDLEGFGADGDFRRHSGDAVVETSIYYEDNDVRLGVRLSSPSEGAVWRTEVVFAITQGNWVGVRTFRDSQQPVARLPTARKPHVIKTIFERLGGGLDDVLRVQDEAHYLGENDCDFASAIASGDLDCYLPIVYLSYPFNDSHYIDPNALARRLSGWAHIVVEPSRVFSIKLQQSSFGRNVYGGAVGLYYPRSKTRRAFFLGEWLTTTADLVDQVTHEVRAALLNRRPLTECSWAGVQEMASRQAIIKLKNSGSQDLEAYAEAFDLENASLKTRLKEAEAEITALKQELSIPKPTSDSSLMLTIGKEQNFFSGEVVEVVLAALDSHSNNCVAGGRRQHILRSIVEANKANASLSSRRDRLKALLKGYRTMTADVESGLAELGFSVADGKHWKLTYMGDDRYTFPIPKSGSDGRGGLNAVSDIAKRVF